ncbi:hypothetical protein HPB48_000985 [Haemaphysalis longicornis]|uniref:Uncharacterized protein n=1 Tax=Haemaphysalis longicornis TaxID=44386 RepID=A0A9J6GZR4_HAELO|nr:hypothetical protein HPB48_000985 [Haemaphysalis longicornis]
MKNRLPKDASLVSDKDIMKSPRGTADQRTRSDNAVACIKWVDKKPIAMVSAAFGIEPTGHCKRWCKKREEIFGRALTIRSQHYNEKMGGVDLRRPHAFLLQPKKPHQPLDDAHNVAHDGPRLCEFLATIQVRQVGTRAPKKKRHGLPRFQALHS